MTSARKISVPVHEIDDLILKILARHPLGLPAAKIRQGLPSSHRIPAHAMAARLEELGSAGKVRCWPPAGTPGKTAPIYSLEPLEPLVQREIASLLTAHVLLLAEMKKRFPPHVARNLQSFLDPLTANGQVKRHPPAKGKRFGLEAPDPLPYFEADLRKLLAKAEKLGFALEEVGRSILKVLQMAPPSPEAEKKSRPILDAENIIFQSMTAIKPSAAQGALVYIPDLRQALRDAFPDKGSFDRAVLELARLEKVQLQSHSLPGELTAEQREAMIDNGRGGYFMAIGIRME